LVVVSASRRAQSSHTAWRDCTPRARETDRPTDSLLPLPSKQLGLLRGGLRPRHTAHSSNGGTTRLTRTPFCSAELPTRTNKLPVAQPREHAVPFLKLVHIVHLRPGKVRLCRHVWGVVTRQENGQTPKKENQGWRRNVRQRSDSVARVLQHRGLRCRSLSLYSLLTCLMLLFEWGVVERARVRELEQSPRWTGTADRGWQGTTLHKPHYSPDHQHSVAER